ncbi:hypothetical protein [Megamonas hypermegale]|uniref:hypothetical protein n=2 Tax=Megamonas hypermegale TaxID=158847 RepID=UPI0026EECE02|nr:hypothetical protein [Megamonas hypermegale]
MYRLVKIICCSVILSAIIQANALASDIITENGFRNLYWGESIEDIRQSYEVTYSKYYMSENAVTYTFNMEPADINGVLSTPFATVNLWNDQLYKITIMFNADTLEQSKHNYDLMVAKISETLPLYKQGTTNDSEAAVWIMMNGTAVMLGHFKELKDGKYVNVLVMDNTFIENQAKKRKSE